MSWLVKLYDTYNNCASEAGKFVEGKRPLVPTEHTTQSAHVEVILNAAGDFLGACVVDKKESTTIIPVTPESAVRTANNCPHPLNDQLKYLAGDFMDYVADKDIKVSSKAAKQEGAEPNEVRVTVNTDFFGNYLAQLDKWADYDKGNKKLQAIATFIRKKTLLQELIASGIFLTDVDGKVIVTKPKDTETVPKIYSLLTGTIQSVLCRFCVEIPGELETRTYADVAMFESWSKYAELREVKSDLCYASGKKLPAAKFHAKFIRNTGDGAKLISGNDIDNYTYRGLFTSSEQAYTVSREVSEKAHAVLKWLLSRQGYTQGDLAVLAWSSGGSTVPSVLLDFMDVEVGIDTAEAYALKVSKSLAGYKQTLQDSDDVNVICFDSAGPGRLAVTYYREFGYSEFLARLETWYTSCSWPKKIKTDAGIFNVLSTPTPYQIVTAAYGKVVDDNLMKMSLKRILPCIVDGVSIPTDFVLKAVNRVSNRSSFETEIEWENALSVTCAIYRKANQREAYGMLLDENRVTRDYLYGRLLAIAENIEDWALRKAGENRQTTASRYFAQFASNPYKTWNIIYSHLQPYIVKLDGKAAGRIKLIDEIMSKFDTEDYLSNKKLSGEYLLGYHNQRHALYSKVTAETNTNKSDEVIDNE